MRLVINLASRGRALLLAQTLGTTLGHLALTDSVLMVSLDEDDADSIAMVTAMSTREKRLRLSVRPREDTIAEKWNRVLENQRDGDVFMPMCDDGPVLTPGFDRIILEAASSFPDGIGVVTNYLENLTFPGIQAVTARLAHLMGYIYPPYFPYWFVDHWLLDITRMIGRDAFVDVRIDCNSNRPPTQEMRESAFWATVYDGLAPLRHAQARTIIDELDEPAWRKAMLIGYFPRHDQHSRMINDYQRANPTVGPASDERYLRVRTLKMLADVLPELESAAARQKEAA